MNTLGIPDAPRQESKKRFKTPIKKFYNILWHNMKSDTLSKILKKQWNKIMNDDATMMNNDDDMKGLMANKDPYVMNNDYMKGLMSNEAPSVMNKDDEDII